MVRQCLCLLRAKLRSFNSNEFLKSSLSAHNLHDKIVGNSVRPVYVLTTVASGVGAMRIEWLVWRSCVHAVAAVSQRGARTEPDWLIALALRTLPRACRVDRKHVTERQPLARGRWPDPVSPRLIETALLTQSDAECGTWRYSAGAGRGSLCPGHLDRYSVGMQWLGVEGAG